MSEEENVMRRVYSVPEAIREDFVALDEFERRLAQAGWRVFSHRPIYRDPLVIRQLWLQTASGNLYTDRAFYHLFAEQSFREVLRLLLTSTVLSKKQFLSACFPSERQTAYFTFLHDQDMLLQSKEGYIKGPQLSHIPDLGHTLEAWTAEWLRRFLAERDIRLGGPPGRVPVRHGVSFTELVGQGDPGDLDVVAVLPKGLVLIECKSSLLQIDLEAWHRFAWRAAFLKPICALLLIDTPASATSKTFQSVQRRLQKWQFVEEAQGNERVCLFQRTGPLQQVSGPVGQILEWEVGTFRAALVGREHNLEETLETVFYAILQNAEKPK